MTGLCAWISLTALSSFDLFFDRFDPIIISPNEVFGDIMVLASPPSRPRPPRRREHSNSKNIRSISFKLYLHVDTLLSYFAI